MIALCARIRNDDPLWSAIKELAKNLAKNLLHFPFLTT